MDNMDAHSQSQHGDNTTEVPNDPGKMFIGGLSWQTSAEGLREYFSKFGDVTEVMVMKDPTTRRSRGFGFVTFADAASVDKVLASAPHELDGKKIDPKVAFPRRAHPKMVTRTKKIFVGGLSAPSTVDDVKNYFEQFGRVEDAMLMFDKQTNRHRGFAFVTFESEDVVDKVCEIHFHEINNKMVECKKAQPKEVMLPVNAARGRAATLRAGYGELLLLSAAAACSASAGNAVPGLTAAAAASSVPSVATAGGIGGGGGGGASMAGLGQLVVPSLSSPTGLHHGHNHSASALHSHILNNPALSSAALQLQQHQNQTSNSAHHHHHHHHSHHRGVGAGAGGGGGGGGGQSPGKAAAAGLSAAAAALLGNGLVSYRYAPYSIPASSNSVHNSSSLSSAQAQVQAAQQQQAQAVAAQAAANEALAASMAGLAGHHMSTLHPHNFSGLYAHPLFAAQAAAAAAAAAGHNHATHATMQDVMAAHHHHAAVQAAVNQANKQRVVAQATHGFLNNNNNSSNNNAAAATVVHGGGGVSQNGELNLSSFAGLEGFYPVPVGL
ncbi:heterogeneous nuclear ribonucleoprotein A1 isoform X2 [Daphnia magna]|uniref:heterogeneous nuclear ribonucleoprotein A1 isoform X2 n=1 Tax=Daphnia magna TaxID=35525 RepID=UPI001E1BBC76|nr:heterogeneous nuclear ribonucleoprotein A1 isoform X2 [Daphnia magna]